MPRLLSPLPWLLPRPRSGAMPMQGRTDRGYRATFIRKVYHLLKCGSSKPLHSDC